MCGDEERAAARLDGEQARLDRPRVADRDLTRHSAVKNRCSYTGYLGRAIRIHFTSTPRCALWLRHYIDKHTPSGQR
jgi:hypothetical protein